MSRRLGLLATACGLALATPFWVGEYVPLVDLPQHLAVTAILRHHDDPAWAFSRFYEVQWRELTPYWLHYLGLDALAHLMPLDTASRVYLSLYALAVPWTGLTLCSAFGAPRWAGLLMAPLALNSNVYFGFLAYVTGVLLMLVVLAAFQRFLTVRTARRAVVLVLLSTILFFTHVQPFAFLLPAASMLAAISPLPPSAPRRLSALLVFVPATAGLFAPWAYLEFIGPRSADKAYNFGPVTDVGSQYRPFSQVAAELAASVAGAYQDGSDTLLLAVWAGLLATLIAVGWRKGGGHRAWRGWLLAALALLCCFVAPMAIRGQWNIAPRFAWLAALLVVAAVDDPGPRLASLGTALAVALTVAVAVNAVHHHRQFGREAGGFAGVLDAIPRGQRVLSLVYDTGGSHVVTQFPYLHFGQYVMAYRGGAAGWSLAKSPPIPVRHRRAEDFPTIDPFRPQDFRAGEHGRHYDYFLGRFGPSAERIFAGAPRPPVLVYTGGPWRVWRNSGAEAPR